MAPNNYDMAIECLRLADRQHLTTASDCAMVESLAAQTYATLALVDAVRSLQAEGMEDLTIAVREEVSDALMDMKGGVK